MNYAIEKEIKIPFNGADYTVRIRMITPRERMDMVNADRVFDVSKFFEKSVVSVSGPAINNKDMKTGADILDTPGTEAIFNGAMVHLREWDISEETQKNS